MKKITFYLLLILVFLFPLMLVSCKTNFPIDVESDAYEMNLLVGSPKHPEKSIGVATITTTKNQDKYNPELIISDGDKDGLDVKFNYNKLTVKALKEGKYRISLSDDGRPGYDPVYIVVRVKKFDKYQLTLHDRNFVPNDAAQKYDGDGTLTIELEVKNFNSPYTIKFFTVESDDNDDSLVNLSFAATSDRSIDLQVSQDRKSITFKSKRPENAPSDFHFNTSNTGADNVFTLNIKFKFEPNQIISNYEYKDVKDSNGEIGTKVYSEKEKDKEFFSITLNKNNFFSFKVEAYWNNLQGNIKLKKLVVNNKEIKDYKNDNRFIFGLGQELISIVQNPKNKTITFENISITFTYDNVDVDYTYNLISEK